MDDSDVMQQFGKYSSILGEDALITYEEGLAEIENFFPNTIDPGMDDQQPPVASPPALPRAQQCLSSEPQVIDSALLSEQPDHVEALNAYGSVSGNDCDYSSSTPNQEELDSQCLALAQLDQSTLHPPTPCDYEAWPLERLVNEAHDRGYRGATRETALVPWLQNNDRILESRSTKPVYTEQELGPKTLKQLIPLVQTKYPARSSGKSKRWQCIDLLTSPSSRASPSPGAIQASTGGLNAAATPIRTGEQPTGIDQNSYDDTANAPAPLPASYDDWTVQQLKSEIIQRGGVCGGTRETKLQWLKDYDEVAAAGGVPESWDRKALGRKHMPELRRFVLYKFPHIVTAHMKKYDLLELLAPEREEEEVDEGEAEGD
ncbi:hypothetical protein LTS18_009357 [Coniosporium uncinatum]|uniref:Uncharacterized protein n=1 Tax=Coniosporium uncinatum TaxID=93489 RepID=A0ACC3DM90_9PEZI|nr:hypothetical protein LTS18_009357 [Coniosporium uncinatum]